MVRKAATEDVAAPSAEKQQATKGNGISANDPFEINSAEVELSLDGRQGNVDDGDVQYNHELGYGDNRQGQSGVLFRRRGTRRFSKLNSGFFYGHHIFVLSSKSGKIN